MRLGIVLLVGLIVSTALVAFVPPRPAYADCPEFLFVGARGSGETPTEVPGDYSSTNHYGMGDRVFDTFSKLSDRIGSTRLEAYGVHYPAVDIADFENFIGATGLPIGDYHNSVDAGYDDAHSKIMDTHTSCPSTKFFGSPDPRVGGGVRDRVCVRRVIGWSGGSA